MQGKRGAHKFMHTRRELCYINRGKEGGSAKMVLHKGEGQENLNMASLHLHQPSPPLNNDPSLSGKWGGRGRRTGVQG